MKYSSYGPGIVLPRSPRLRADGGRVWVIATAVGELAECVAHAHVARVEPPAVVLEGADQRVELAPDRDARRRERRLRLARLIDQRLKVVHAAEEILSAFEHAKVLPRLRACGFSRELDAVAQFLDGDPDRMQPL